MKPCALPLAVIVVLLTGTTALHAAPPQTAAVAQPGAGLHDIPDPELNLLRGRYTVGDNAVAWFGVTMISTWQGPTGQILQGTLAIGMNFTGHAAQPQVSFQPSVSITPADVATPMPAIATANRSVDASGLGNVGGVVQSVQVAGNDNLASNVIGLNIHDGGAAPHKVADASNHDASATLAGASAKAGFDGQNASVNLAVDGSGTVQQWIRNGSFGQSVQLTADDQAIRNVMQIDLVRQAIAGNTQLTQNVAQSINLMRGIGNR